MRRRFRWLGGALCILFAVACLTAAALPPKPAHPTVTLEEGTLEGKHFGPAQDAAAFLGVPYAAPPVGDLRWRPPEPVKKWSGAREAKRFGAACPQLEANWLPHVDWNEDCLYLNVWTPQLSATSKLPVIVFFHGGSNVAGYSQSSPLGPVFSRLGVVVVSANYRLGALGFLALPALTAESPHHSSGNYGLLDQIQALQWVRQNIAQFGGDPNRVTVMGQSSGAFDICLLMASPLAAGLFQGAIMESGECQSVFNKDIRAPIPYNSIFGSGESAGQRFADDLGVGKGPDTLQELRSIPAKKLLEVWTRHPEVRFDVIVDGWIVPEQPARIFAEGREMHVPVLVGSNADEWSTFQSPGDPKTLNQYKQALVNDTGEYAGEEFAAYPALKNADVPAAYLRVQADWFAYGAYSLAQAMTRAGQNAYLYCFTYADAGNRAPLGAYHGEELDLLSNSFPGDWEHEKAEKSLAEALRGYWTQFAKTGDPNGPGLPEWPAYAARPDRCLELGRTIRVQPLSRRVQILEHIMDQIFAGSEDVPRTH
jgi:para-nitrobenzyl esterase